MNIDEVADRLYGLPPEEFTAARDEVAREATDNALRKAVKALRRPTAPAHAVNLLVRDRGEDIDRLLELGEEMRASMGGDPGEVRRQAEERRSLIADLIDRDLPTGVQQDVTATLEAATADPELGAAVRSGRLVKPLRYAGFGSMPDLDDAVATPLRAEPRNRTPTKAKQAPKRATRKAKAAASGPAGTSKKPADADASPDLSAARDHVLELSGRADDAQRRYELAVKAATEARRLLDQAEKERATAHKAANEAHRAAEKARRELGRLERS